MTEMLEFDRETARRLEALYTTPAAVARRREYVAALLLHSGERVLDVGCGPGFVAAEMADAIGATGRVCGVDVSESMLALARARCGDRIEFLFGDATLLPLDDGVFDVAVATQVYEYVSDLEPALTELRRVLRPGGRALIVDTDWESIVWHASDPQRMRRVLAAWDEHLATRISRGRSAYAFSKRALSSDAARLEPSSRQAAATTPSAAPSLT